MSRIWPIQRCLVCPAVSETSAYLWEEHLRWLMVHLQLPTLRVVMLFVANRTLNTLLEILWKFQLNDLCFLLIYEGLAPIGSGL